MLEGKNNTFSLREIRSFFMRNCFIVSALQHGCRENPQEANEQQLTNPSTINVKFRCLVEQVKKNPLWNYNIYQCHATSVFSSGLQLFSKLFNPTRHSRQLFWMFSLSLHFESKLPRFVWLQKLIVRTLIVKDHHPWVPERSRGASGTHGEKDCKPREGGRGRGEGRWGRNSHSRAIWVCAAGWGRTIYIHTAVCKMFEPLIYISM